MALTQSQAFNLTRSSQFTGRVQFMASAYSNYVLGSADSADPGNPGYGASKTLARRVQRNFGGMCGAIAVSLISKAEIVAGATNGTEGTDTYDINIADATLQGYFEGMWNARLWDSIDV